MPRKADHFGIALLIFVAGAVVFGKLGFITPIFYTLFLAIGSILPAIFEPVHPYTHRNFYHSKTMMRRCCYGIGITFFLGIYSQIFMLIMFLTLGYVMHLLMDAPSGLPD